MKKLIKTVTLSMVAISLSIGSISSCKKTPKEAAVVEVLDISQANKSIPISCSFGSNNTTNGCVNEMGICLKPLASLEELDALALNENESKGQGWARKQSDGNIALTLSLGTTNIDQSLLTEWLTTSEMHITSECLIPNSVVENCLRTDKITFPPNARVAIPKGAYPISVTLPSGSTKTPEVVLKVTLNEKCDYVGHVTLLR